jgi:aarF domain-containing kinase
MTLLVIYYIFFLKTQATPSKFQDIKAVIEQNFGKELYDM